MQFIYPDFLEDGRGLSIAVYVEFLTFGFALWLFGWRWHRFWVVLGSTLIAGLVGLNSAQAYNIHPLVGALVLSVITGALSLVLVRVVAFVGGGLICWMLFHTLAPQWDAPILCFIAGGLIGVFLLRLWITAVTSLVGSLLMAYATLCLLDRWHKLDAPVWTGDHVVLLNWLTGGLAVLGLLVQLLIERRRAIRQRAAESKAKEKEKEKDKEKKDSQPKKPPWWTLGLPMYRQAG